MKGLLTFGLALIAGGVGFIVGSKWTEKNLKTKLEDQYQEEFELLKKTYEENNENTPTPEAVEAVAEAQTAMKKAAELQKKINEDIAATGQEEEDIMCAEYKGPYTVTKEQYKNECANYTDRQLTWNASTGILTDDDDPTLVLDDNIDDLVGFDNLDYLESTGEIIYVRNDTLKTDFQISLEE